MPTVTVLPGRAVLDVGQGENLMAAALRQGYRWPSICEGEGTCTTCFVRIKEGVDAARPAREAEDKALELIRLRFPENPSAVRLACQLVLDSTPLTVFRPGVRKTLAPAGEANGLTTATSENRG